jgi:hypothetical protein
MDISVHIDIAKTADFIIKVVTINNRKNNIKTIANISEQNDIIAIINFLE